MRIVFDKNIFVIESPSLLNLLGLMIGFSKRTRPAMGMALPFCIIMRNLEHPMHKTWMNHERIHIRQIWESLGIAFLIAKLEYLYARVILKYSHAQANRYECIEQECYLNQDDPQYLESRRFWSFWRYIFNKTVFYIDKNYQVKIVKSL